MNRRTFIWFTLPSVFIMLALMVFPLVTTVYLSFNEIFLRDLGSSKWVGLGNYRDVLSDPDFWAAFRLTILFVVVVVPVHLVIGLAIANVLDRVAKGRGIYMAALLLPFVVTPVVGTLLVRNLFDRGGLVSWLWEIFTDDPFVITTGNVKWVMIVHGIWAVTPFAVITFFAGLQTLPQDRVEAAGLDGAGFWSTQRFVVIPHLKSLITFILLITIMDAYRVFDSSFVFGQGVGKSAHTLQVYNFEVALSQQIGRLGKGNAIAVLTVIGIFVVLIPFLQKSYKEQVADR